jgi:hypothetical protein
LFAKNYAENKETITEYKQIMKNIGEKIEESRVYIFKEDQ